MRARRMPTWRPPNQAATLVVRGVAKLLRRAIRNLLENARRYSNGPVR
jgi:two-component system OmpR family sensor kinase